MLVVFLLFLLGTLYLGDLTYFYSFRYHFSTQKLQQKAIFIWVSLEPQTLISCCPVGVSTRCPQQWFLSAARNHHCLGKLKGPLKAVRFSGSGAQDLVLFAQVTHLYLCNQLGLLLTWALGSHWDPSSLLGKNLTPPKSNPCFLFSWWNTTHPQSPKLVSSWWPFFFVLRFFKKYGPFKSDGSSWMWGFL